MATGWIRATRVHLAPHISKRASAVNASANAERTVVTGDPMESPFFSSWQPYIRVGNIAFTTAATYFLIRRFFFKHTEALWKLNEKDAKEIEELVSKDVSPSKPN